MLKKLKERLKAPVAYFKFKGNIGNNDYHQPILSGEDGNSAISSHLRSNKPFMVARIGATELGVINNHISNAVNKESKWNENLLKDIHQLSGVFPQELSIIEQFANKYINCIRSIDNLCIWNNIGENFLAEYFCPNANLLPLKSVEPYYYLNEPWSMLLAKKKVLVIHPFVETIRMQYLKRELLFPNTDVLPKFELLTLKAIQSLGQTPTGYETWFDALEYMQNQIKNIDFDIAIIGAGAYGLPLAAYVKQLHKQAIHMGGATQILFGIKGKRWDTHPIISNLYNEHWVYPSDEDKPANFKNVEDGCYW
jgi:hypothetical protein